MITRLLFLIFLVELFQEEMNEQLSESRFQYDSTLFFRSHSHIVAGSLFSLFYFEQTLSFFRLSEVAAQWTTYAPVTASQVRAIVSCNIIFCNFDMEGPYSQWFFDI